jgi:hypothetical protein
VTYLGYIQTLASCTDVSRENTPELAIKRARESPDAGGFGVTIGARREDLPAPIAASREMRVNPCHGLPWKEAINVAWHRSRELGRKYRNPHCASRAREE